MIALLNTLPPHSFQKINFQFFCLKEKKVRHSLPLHLRNGCLFFFPFVLEEPPANILLFRVFPQNGPGERGKKSPLNFGSSACSHHRRYLRK